MKSTLILAALLTLTACAPRKKVTKLIENPYDNSANDARFTDIEQRLSQLESDVNSNIGTLQTLGQSVSAHTTQLQSLQAQLNSGNYVSQSDLQAAISELEGTISQLDGLVDDLNDEVIAAQADITAIKTGSYVKEVVNLCTNSAGAYKEVLFKTGDNKYIAYFETGTNRFLSVLEEGKQYQTTDGRSCKFYIQNGAVIEGNVPTLHPIGATHKLNFCGGSAYKVGNTLVNGNPAPSCTPVVNNGAEDVSANGCNFNNVSSLQTGANVGNGCSVEKL